MKILKKAKENAFALLVVAAYAALFAVRWDMGVDSLKNSVYYIKEMLLIMPVVFILTALLDLWVPKEKIMKFLGREAGAKGALFSLMLGSVSAGPIYAAFPLCVMLHKKGASVRNLVVILSAWAVIKLPMLLNEMKFLGLKFMAARWVLTVAAIILFAWITAKIVKDRDLPQEDVHRASLSVNQAACIGCSLCVQNCPELFEMRNRKASIKPLDGDPDRERLANAMEACPVKAISCPEEAADPGRDSGAVL